MRLVLVVCILFSSRLACSQQYQTRQGLVSFFAEAPIENIAATNKNVFFFVDPSTGEITGRLAIANFEFKKPLMKTHFNEKYMESKQFPEGAFRGRITGYKPIEKGQQEVKVNGMLTIHGQTREVEMPVVMQAGIDRITLSTVFVLRLADYGIKAPRMFWSNIIEDVEVKANFTFLLEGN